MDSDLAELIVKIGAIALVIWIGRRIYVKRPGIFSNRLKDIKRERAQDEDSRPL